MSNKGYKVAIVEDDPVFATYLGKTIRNNGFECVAITELNEPNFLAQASDADVFLVDYHLGHVKLNGLNVCQQIIATVDKPVIMLTSEQSTKVLVECLEAGAEQYVNKPCPIEELVARINVVLRSEKGLRKRSFARSSVGELQFKGLELSREFGTLTYGHHSITLTQREQALADILLCSPTLELSRDEVFLQLFGFEMPPFSRAVDVIVTRLRKKLAELSVDIRLMTVRNRGYSLHIAKNLSADD